MSFFSKLFGNKNNTAKGVAEDRELIESNEKSINAIIVLVEGNDELVEKLKELQVKLKFLVASDNAKVKEADKKIKNLIGDLRIEAGKAGSEESKKAEGILRELRACVEDRNARL